MDKEMRDRHLTINVGPDLALRLVTQEDADRIFRLVEANRQFLKQWISWADERFDDNFNQKLIQNNLDAYDAGTAYAMGIYAQGKLAGVVDIRNLDGIEEPEIGYWLEEAAQGKGYATRSAQALINYAKRQHGIKKVVLRTMVDNDASSGVAERLGFRLVDNHVSSDEVHGKWYELDL
jgi:ribosomal-protein-serine acetyltransferase